MINQKRRSLLKGFSLLAVLPVISLSAFEGSMEKNHAVDSSKYVKREFTLTNLTPSTLMLDYDDPIKVPAYNDSSKVRFNLDRVRGAILAPGDDITFDVIVAKENMLDVSIDEVEIKSNQADYEHIVSAMNFTAQISII